MYYVTEQGNPEVVTITNAAHPHYQLPQQVERPLMELRYSTIATAASIQSSPRTFSATSVSSPIAQECFYAYLPRNRPEYAQADSQQSIIQYQQPMQQLMSQSQQEKWSNDDLPIEVTAIGQLPVYETTVYDPCGPKIEVNDPSMQLPSSRLGSL
jgi:transcriptional regulator with AAA-type ATPase domain